MSSQFKVIYTVPSNAQTVKDKLHLIGGTNPYSRASIVRIASYTEAVAGGQYSGKLQTYTSAVAASGTVTFSSIAAADTVTIGATVFTGNNSASGTAQFLTNATPSAAADKVAAASLAAVINANTTTNKMVVASNVAGTAVVTITSIDPGLLGNFYPIAISAHGSVSGSGLLTSGAEDAVVTLANGQA